MSKLLSPETSYDGVVSDQKVIKPSKPSLILFTTLVNKTLVDTGATATFISERILKHLKPYKIIHMKPYSFVLADGTAPFQIVGKVRITILFAGIRTLIDAYIARKLRTNIILGMDYINFYYLNFDIKRQVISLEHQNRVLIMNINPDKRVTRIPVTSSKPIVIPPHSTRAVPVNVPISSITSSVAPDRTLSNSSSLFIRQTFIKFNDYRSRLFFSNTSSFLRPINKGYHVEFLLHQQKPHSLTITSSVNKLSGSTGLADFSSNMVYN